MNLPSAKFGLATLRPNRREFLSVVGALIASALGRRRLEAGGVPGLSENPFTLGVASGDPLHDSVILWTRLFPVGDAGDVPVQWEVAADEAFANPVQSGEATAIASLGHSVHVQVDALQPHGTYWYRFRLGDWSSPAGRTRTLPAPDSSPERFRIGLASCQRYTSGLYTAHAHLAEEDLDLVAFVGDYIYESGIEGSVRDHTGASPLRTLDDFRERYALYRSDENLQAAHQRFPWVVTWDDHEVRNNYADLSIPGISDEEEARALRAAAYQAYYEHMPLRISAPNDPTHMAIHHSFPIGDLATIYVLDGRQYRTEQACDDQFGPACPELENPDRTMLGTDQKQWLLERMAESSTIWNVIAQQTVFTALNVGGQFVNPDQWDGYPVERRELTNAFRDIRNVVVLSGDIHAGAFGTVHLDPDDPGTEAVAVEVVCTSISSGTPSFGNFDPEQLDDLIVQLLAHVYYAEVSRRGYAVCELERDRMRVRFRAVSTVEEPVAEITTHAAFEVEADTRRIVQTVAPPTPIPTATATPTATPSPTPPACPGDCNGDRQVTVEELVRAVRIALGEENASACAAADANGDGTVSVDDLVRAVNAALSGCNGAG